MPKPAAAPLLLVIPFLSLLLACCSGTRNVEEERKARIRPISLDSLAPNQPVYLKIPDDSIPNCDSGSQFKRISKAHAAADAPGKNPGYDSFSLDGNPVLRMAYLRTQSDSLYVLATVGSADKENAYASICIERKHIGRIFVDRGNEPRREGRKGKGGGHGRGRRGGMPSGGM
jgi:hypothetical protein